MNPDELINMAVIIWALFCVACAPVALAWAVFALIRKRKDVDKPKKRL